MESLQPAQAQVNGGSLEVEFYPSIDDYVQIALTMNSTIPVKSATSYAYYLFLFVNTIIFPAFLLMSNYYLLGIIIFLINVTAVIFVIPRVNLDGYRKHYQKVYGDLEDTLVKVQLTEPGFHCFIDGAQSFMAWRRVTSIEETDESIFFFDEASGIAIRKNGFAYREDCDRFLLFAREKLSEAKHKLPQVL